MAIGDSASVLIKIRADSKDAAKEFDKVKADLKGLDDDATKAGAGFASMAGPAAAAAATIAAVGTAAIAASVALFKLVQSTAAYGGEIEEAMNKTGLGAETLSALKFKADQAGISLDTVTGAIAKFSKSIDSSKDGLIVLGSETITAAQMTEDFEGSLERAFTAINNAKSGYEQLTIANKAFGRSGPDVIDFIKSFNGNIKEATDEAKKFGQVISDETARSSAEFEDALFALERQAGAVGREFAFELMPNVTSAMQTSSGAMSNNTTVARSWGRDVGDMIRGVEVALYRLDTGANVALGNINKYFGTNAKVSIDWMTVILSSAGIVGQALQALRTDGAANPLALKGSIGGKFGGGVAMPSMPSGGGGGGGGGATGPDPAVEAEKQRKAEAEKQRKAEVDAAQKAVSDQLEIYKAGYSERIATLETFLSRGEILEIEKIRDVARVRLEALMDEKRLTEELLANDKINLNEEERAEILQKIKVLTIEIRVEKLKGGKEINEQVKKEIADAEKLLEIEKERLETERKRIQAINERKQQEFNRQIRERQERLRKLEEEKKARSFGGLMAGGSFGSILGNINDKFDADGHKISEGLGVMGAAFQSLKEMGAAALESLAQGVGSLIQNWVLMGTVGPNAMRKVVASILAGVAAQAAVQAIMFTAYGIAALTPWGKAIYGPAAQWFKAAALMASIAVVAGVTGRAVAGDSFSQGSSTATGSGQGGSGQGPQQNSFTTQFRGFGDQQRESLRQNAMVMSQLEETVHRLDRRITGMSPGDVVAMAADENPGAFRTGYEGSLSDDYKTTGGFMRQAGLAR